MNFALKGLALMICLAVIVLVNSKTAVARPSDAYKHQSSYTSRFCDGNQDKLYVCQKCAKQTKSADVYPNCCMEKDGVHIFCHRYVYYGVMSDLPISD